MHCPYCLRHLAIITLFLSWHFLFEQSVSHAENKQTIRLGCVIPVIPGVNTPILDEKTAVQTVSIQRPQDSRIPILFQKETSETRTIGSAEEVVTVQTVYGR